MQVRTASCAGTACVNSFGDEQLAVDMVADKLLFDALRFSVSPRHRRCLNRHACEGMNAPSGFDASDSMGAIGWTWYYER
jgi:hypothetical protein